MMDQVPGLYKYEKQKWDLIDRYRDRSLSDTFDVSEKGNSKGHFYKINDSTKIEKPKLDREKAIEAIQSDFQLIKGVGSKTEKKLKNKGLSTFYDLKEEGLYEDRVDEIIQDIEEFDIHSLQGRINRWHNLKHPLNLHLLSLTDIQKVLFFDIETLGLSDCPVFLIGVGSYDDGLFNVDQFLAKDLNGEEAIIKAFNDKLDEFDYLASFNGRRFDSTFIKNRCKYHDLTDNMNLPHFDLLHMARGRWNDSPNHKLITLEKYLFSSSREDDVPSSLIPNYYKTYLKKNNPGPLIPIIKHNKLDIITLFRMLREF